MAARGIEVASQGNPLVPLVAVSGSDCIEALQLAGFTTRSKTDHATTLERGLHVVVVPDVAMVPPGDLQMLLRDAGVTYSDFLDMLSEAPTDPDVLRTTTGVRRKTAPPRAL